MAIVTLTQSAQQRLQELMEVAPQDASGLRLRVKQGGCSGYSYDLDYAVEADKFGETVAFPGGQLYVDPGAIMFLLGCTMDFKSDRFSSGFDFQNPNEKGRCGCGESIAF